MSVSGLTASPACVELYIWHRLAASCRELAQTVLVPMLPLRTVLSVVANIVVSERDGVKDHAANDPD